MKRRHSVNPKRRLRDRQRSKSETSELQRLASKVTYAGNPSHKRNPGDFGLTPPSQPREGKTLCDGVGIVTRSVAEALLKEGLRRGLVSIQERNGWPKNIWAVHENSAPLEAILENAETGTYHGYPMQHDDPLRAQVLERWQSP
jgi:hypothetical protein